MKKSLSPALLALLLLLNTGCASLLAQASDKHQQGDLEGALADYKTLMAKEPTNPMIYNNMAVLYLSKKNYRLALMTYKKAVNMQPNNPVFQDNLIKACQTALAQTQEADVIQMAQEHLAEKGLIPPPPGEAVAYVPPPKEIVPSVTPSLPPTEDKALDELEAMVSSSTAPTEMPAPEVVAPSVTPTAAVAMTPEEIERKIDEAVARKIAEQNRAKEVATSVTQPQITGRKIALVIGISQYSGDDYKPLTYAASDAHKVYNYLTQEAGFDPQQVKLLLNENATAANIRQAFRSWLHSQVTSSDDIVLVYYSGHGETTFGKDGYIVPVEVAKREDISGQGVALEDINSTLDKLDSKKVALMIDSCYSGAVIPGQAKGGHDLFNSEVASNFLKMASTGRLILTSSAPTEKSLEFEELQGGLFTHFLLEGLRGKADTVDADKRVTVDELFRYITQNVKMYARQKSLDQNPQKAGEMNGVIAEVQQ